MSSYADVEALLDESKVKPPKPKAIKPLKTAAGEMISEEEVHRQSGDYEVAVPMDSRTDNPFSAQRCSVRGCKEGVQFSIGGGPLASFEMPEYDAAWGDDPLTVRLEATLNQVRPGVQVPERETVHLCLGHWHSFLKAREARAAEERKAREVPSWPLYALNYSGETIEFLDDRWFRLTDGDGKVMDLEIAMSLREVNARMKHGKYEQQVLTREEVQDFKLAVKAQEFTAKIAPRAVAEAKF